MADNKTSHRRPDAPDEPPVIEPNDLVFTDEEIGPIAFRLFTKRRLLREHQDWHDAIAVLHGECDEDDIA